MAIIAIAREIGSLAEEIAQELSRLGGYRYIDKETLEAKLSTMTPYGLSTEKRQKFDEKKPGFWASLSQERDTYLHFLKTAIFEEAASGNCIFVGRGSGSILKNLPGLLAIRLTAPLTIRLERIKAAYSCNDKSALEILERSDHDRRGFHKYFFSINWEDSREYDFTINTRHMTPETGARAINALVRETIDQETEKACLERIADLMLSQSVITKITYEKKVPIHFLEASSYRGRILLHGVANAQSAIDTAVAAARTVPNVSEVESAIQIIQEFSVMP